MKYLFPIFILALFIGCQSNADKKQSSENSNPATTQTNEDLEIREYEGLLPCADCPGIRYNLKLQNKEHTGDGTFELDMTYLEAENGKDATFSSTGKWITLRGDADDINATVYQLNPDSVESIMNFLMLGDSLVMLDRDQKRIDSGLNYTLKLKQ